MDTLLSDIEAFTARHQMSEWAFGDAALNDRHFLRQLREGREPRRATVEKARSFMREYRPSAPEQVAA